MIYKTIVVIEIQTRDLSLIVTVLYREIYRTVTVAHLIEHTPGKRKVSGLNPDNDNSFIYFQCQVKNTIILDW